MTYDPKIDHRKSIRLPGHDYAGGGVYFVTICAHREAGNVFANQSAKRVAEESWRKIPEHFPNVCPGEFVVMPDHVHGIIRIVGAKNLSPLPDADVYFGGWHSAMEKSIFDWLLKNGRRVIAWPTWGIEDSAFEPDVRSALEENRMLILEMRDTSGNLAAAEARNRFVIQHADALFTPYVSPGGMLERLLKERKSSDIKNA